MYLLLLLLGSMGFLFGTLGMVVPAHLLPWLPLSSVPMSLLVWRFRRLRKESSLRECLPSGSPRTQLCETIYYVCRQQYYVLEALLFGFAIGYVLLVGGFRAVIAVLSLSHPLARANDTSLQWLRFVTSIAAILSWALVLRQISYAILSNRLLPRIVCAAALCWWITAARSFEVWTEYIDADLEIASNGLAVALAGLAGFLLLLIALAITDRKFARALVREL